jgi:hypothetical protein
MRFSALGITRLFSGLLLSVPVHAAGKFFHAGRGALFYVRWSRPF